MIRHQPNKSDTKLNIALSFIGGRMQVVSSGSPESFGADVSVLGRRSMPIFPDNFRTNNYEQQI